MKKSIVNNFDIIRLFAALQVAIKHSAEHLGFNNIVVSVLSIFPGVPIFFFISGFLIYSSYKKSLSSNFPLKNFFIKRALRLYPALLLCFIFTISLVALSGYIPSTNIPLKSFVFWALTQLTFFQFFNPEFLRDYGVGAINGSLWTISVELQFYILTPLVCFLFRQRKGLVLSVIFVFCVANVLNVHLNDKSSIVVKLIGVSFAPWIYMFLLGAFLSSKIYLVERILDFDFRLIILAYVAAWWLSGQFNLGWGNGINPIAYLLMIFLILKFAFTNPSLSDQLLRRNDISYGVYIFHMPIVNFLLYKNITGTNGFFLALLLTAIVAILSWVFIERPALRLKRNQLRKTD